MNHFTQHNAPPPWKPKWWLTHIGLSKSVSGYRVIRRSLLDPNSPKCRSLPFEDGGSMPKTPNYKQDKKRREDAQKKRNAEEQLRQRSQKVGPPPPRGDASATRKANAQMRTRRGGELVRCNSRLARESRDRLGLCPFAERVYLRRQIRYHVSRKRPRAGFLRELEAELRHLHGADPAACETTLLIHPHVLGDFAGLQPVSRRGGCDRSRARLGGCAAGRELSSRVSIRGNRGGRHRNYSIVRLSDVHLLAE